MAQNASIYNNHIVPIEILETFKHCDSACIAIKKIYNQKCKRSDNAVE